MGLYEALKGPRRPRVFHALPGCRKGESLCRGRQQGKQEGLTNKDSISMATAICGRGQGLQSPPALLHFLHLWPQVRIPQSHAESRGKGTA